MTPNALFAFRLGNVAERSETGCVSDSVATGRHEQCVWQAATPCVHLVPAAPGLLSSVAGGSRGPVWAYGDILASVARRRASVGVKLC